MHPTLLAGILFVDAQREPIHAEVLLGNPALASLIREGKTFQIPSIMQTSKRQGMVTRNDSLFKLVKEGAVEPKEAWMKSVDKNGLLGMFKSNGVRVDFA